MVAAAAAVVAMAVVTEVMVEVVVGVGVGVEVPQGPRKPVLGTGPALTATTSALPAGWLLTLLQQYVSMSEVTSYNCSEVGCAFSICILETTLQSGFRT